MNKSNILNVFEQLIQESYFHCEWAIEWREQENDIVLIFQMTLSNPNNHPFRDTMNITSNHETILYTVKIIIYDNRQKEFSHDDYIVSIPLNYEMGIDYGECLSIVKYLKNLTSSVNIKWLEFLSDTKAEKFSLEWKWNEFEEIRNRLIESNRYSKTPIYFPQQNDIN
ncbi:DUF3013 family protein [Aerococcaceae bacterium DSM 111021]|nr:DUF3013 family protein [Aerococcaceae bacterium DSM 111021]